jgi:hypothetical protein
MIALPELVRMDLIMFEEFLGFKAPNDRNISAKSFPNTTPDLFS